MLSMKRLMGVAIAAIVVGAAICVPLSGVPVGSVGVPLKPFVGAGDEEVRLIQTSPTEARWVKASEVAQLMLSETGFMDITEHPFLEGLTPVNSNGGSESESENETSSIPTAPRFPGLVSPLLPLLSIDAWKKTVDTLAAYGTRFYRSTTGASSSQWVAEQYRTIAQGSQRSDLSVRTFAHANYNQVSVIARMEGDGTSSEIVVLGGHLDSISSGSSAPGADDDASGTATVLEVFRVLVQSGYKPRRAIEFHAYAAEEAGLLGSQDVAADYSARRIQVAAMTQFDMTCYPGTRGTKNIGMTTDFTSPALTSFLKALVDTYTSATYASSTCGYGCSDHASFHKYGYPAAFPFEAPFGQHNPDIHTVRDTIDKCDLGVAANFLKLALSFGVEMSAATD
eukprot:TRINITY_DN223_c0_g1_i1.p1 TRINITY_DN223_c0_g1~~TRINITY_DN223_c0_g1_i1.p1  ORF type:complete len:396 (-),score=37.80 TRINITY_DN223_c0_g1_i1:321-1508(-)